MAESIGGKFRNFMVAILVGLLVVAFAVWGVNDVFTARAGNAVITVGDAEITSSEFEQAFERELQTQNRDNNSSVTNQQAYACLLYTSPSPRDKRQSRMPSSA